MDTPIIINNRDRLTTTKKLVEDLLEKGYTNIHIIDNDSTYGPLLKWYKTISGVVHIHRLENNTGHLALWSSGIMSKFSKYEYVAYTDSDIELNNNTPREFIKDLIKIADHFKIDKVGLAIKYDDIPDTKYCRKVRRIEAEYWKKKLIYHDYELYSAPIDTTFAVVNQKKPFSYGAIRIAGDYTCRHVPFYLDWANMDKEEQFVMITSDAKISTYKQNYLEWKAENQ